MARAPVDFGAGECFLDYDRSDRLNTDEAEPDFNVWLLKVVNRCNKARCKTFPVNFERCAITIVALNPKRPCLVR